MPGKLTINDVEEILNQFKKIAHPEAVVSISTPSKSNNIISTNGVEKDVAFIVSFSGHDISEPTEKYGIFSLKFSQDFDNTKVSDLVKELKKKVKETEFNLQNSNKTI